MPLNYAILKYMTAVDKASAKDVVTALCPVYGSFRNFSEKSILEALMTGVQNSLLEEACYDLDDKGDLVIYYHAPESGREAINSYIKD